MIDRLESLKSRIASGELSVKDIDVINEIIKRIQNENAEAEISDEDLKAMARSGITIEIGTINVNMQEDA